MVDAVEPQIRALLAEFPDLPSTVILELTIVATATPARRRRPSTEEDR
jgi:hypothetical protein